MIRAVTAFWSFAPSLAPHLARRHAAAYREPGEKPGLIRDLAYQSEAFIEERGSNTVPPLMREIWRMGMRGPQGQLTNPFFTGGLQITISYPTYDMSHDFKLMSMRGNNSHFNRATVHHELIPGHAITSSSSGSRAFPGAPRTRSACCSGGGTARPASSSP